MLRRRRRLSFFFITFKIQKISTQDICMKNGLDFKLSFDILFPVRILTKTQDKVRFV